MLVEDPVSQIPPHHDTGVPSVEELPDPVEDTVTETKEFNGIMYIGI